MFDFGIELRHCDSCSSVTRFDMKGTYPDGSQRMICSGCNRNGGVIHKCDPTNSFTAPDWLPLVLAGIDIVCPKCKAAYDLGIKIEPTFPTLGEFLQTAGVVIGGVILISVGVEIVQDIRRAMA